MHKIGFNESETEMKRSDRFISGSWLAGMLQSRVSVRCCVMTSRLTTLFRLYNDVGMIADSVSLILKASASSMSLKFAASKLISSIDVLTRQQNDAVSH